MKKNIVLLALLFLTYSQAQQKSYSYIPEIYPKTPENAALIKNIDLPPGTYTGTYGYKVDLGSISLKNLNLPISLDYSTTGIRVNNISGRVGTGWVLNVGNISLNRDVRGVSDNVVEELKLDKKYYEFQPNEDKPLTSGDNDYMKALRLTGVNNLPGKLPVLDANKDYFIYSLPSKSGRFIQDSKGNFHTIPKDDIKISNITTLIDDQGNTYFFSEYRSITNSNLHATPTDNTYTNSEKVGFSYRLDSIKLPTNEIIQFKYESDSYNFTASYDKSLDLKTDGTDKDRMMPCPDYGKAFSVSRNHQHVTDQVIKEVIYPNGQITFDYVSNNQEVIGGKVLKSIKFYQNNELYKNYNLESDFTTSTTPSQIIPQNNQENLNKRLFLFKVNESLTNTNYSFNYYGVDKRSLKTDFPSRFSGKEDYWGNYSSAGDFLPSSNKYVDKSGILTSYEGANKNPRLNDAIIGSMKSIQFPTGGFQQIKYELDDFYDEGYKEYYEEQKNIGTFASASEVQQSVTKSFVVEDSNFTSPKLTFSYEGMEKVDYDPTTLPQSLPTVSHYYVEVFINNKPWKKLYDKGPHDIYRDPTVANSVNLEKGDILSFKFTYVFVRGLGSTPSLNFNVPATIGLSYFIKKEREIPFVYRTAGNLRVQELVLKEDANTETYKKQYIYKKFDQPDEPSGFFLGRDMNMNYYTRTKQPTYNTDPDNFCEYLNVSSQNYFNLYALENKSIVYPNVTEKIINLKDSSYYTIEKEFYIPYRKGYSQYQLPYSQGPYNGYMGGLLKNETYKDDKGSIVRTITNIYEFDNYFNQFSSKYDSAYPEYLYPAMDISIRSSYAGPLRSEVFTFDVNAYYYPSTWIKLKETKEVDFFENKQFIEKIKTFNYNYNQIKPISEVTTTSKGEIITTEYQYPPDLTSGYTDSNKMSQLVLQNRISEPVITKQKVGNTYISEIHNQYAEFNGIIQKSVVHQKKGSGIDINKTDDRKVIYSSYDNKGNLTQYALQNGISVAIIWGYNGQYPIAKIEGAAYSEVSAYISDLETKSNDGSLTKESFNTLRTAFPHAMITTYVYQPLVGVTSITTPNGQTEYYKYDASNRLEEIRNDKKEVIKTFKYNYKN